MADQVDYVGQRLGNYRLIRQLGQGGFAEVYLGEHIHLKTQAAVKLLHKRLTNDDIENFRREAQTIASLVHPHIVRVLDFGVEGHAPFLVMDYAPNGTLRSRHPKGTRVLSFVEILFAVRTITFRGTSLFKKQDGHFLTHNFSLQQRTSFSYQEDCENGLFRRDCEKLSVRKGQRCFCSYQRVILPINWNFS